MDHIYNIAKFLHVIGFAFMSIPLFNLIIVNERALMGPSLHYATDRYFENIIKRGAIRCYVFQCTVFVSGIVILFLGPGLNAIWTNWVLTAKTLILLLLMSYFPMFIFLFSRKLKTCWNLCHPLNRLLQICQENLRHFEFFEKN